jgi:hypothetical protein
VVLVDGALGDGVSQFVHSSTPPPILPHVGGRNYGGHGSGDRAL